MCIRDSRTIAAGAVRMTDTSKLGKLGGRSRAEYWTDMTGVDAFDESGNFSLRRMLQGLQSLGDQGLTNRQIGDIINKAFQVRATSKILPLLTSEDLVGKFDKRVHDLKFNVGGRAAEAAAVRMEGLFGSMKRFEATMHRLSVIFTERVEKPLTAVLDFITTHLKSVLTIAAIAISGIATRSLLRGLGFGALAKNRYARAAGGAAAGLGMSYGTDASWWESALYTILPAIAFSAFGGRGGRRAAAPKQATKAVIARAPKGYWGKLQGALSSTFQGALAGSFLGPKGMLIGAGIGLGTWAIPEMVSYFKGSPKPKEQILIPYDISYASKMGLDLPSNTVHEFFQKIALKRKPRWITNMWGQKVKVRGKERLLSMGAIDEIEGKYVKGLDSYKIGRYSGDIGNLRSIYQKYTSPGESNAIATEVAMLNELHKDKGLKFTERSYRAANILLAFGRTDERLKAINWASWFPEFG